MEVEGTLTVLAEIAIAIAGFSGIVAGLSRRSELEWGDLDRVRLGMLLQSSFVVAFFSLLTLVLASTDIDFATVWRISSAGWLAYMGVSLILSWRRYRVLRGDAGSLPPEASRPLLMVLLIGAAFSIGAQLANTISLGVPWPHLAALLWGLVAAAMFFARLVRASVFG